MMPRRAGDDAHRVFALEVVQRTREAWLPQAAMVRGLNPDAMQEPKRWSVPDGACQASPRPRRRPWGSIAMAIAVVAAVLAGELWAVRAASSLDATAANGIVGDVSVTLSRVAEASLIGPVD